MPDFASVDALPARYSTRGPLYWSPRWCTRGTPSPGRSWGSGTVPGTHWLPPPPPLNLVSHVKRAEEKGCQIKNNTGRAHIPTVL